MSKRKIEWTERHHALAIARLGELGARALNEGDQKNAQLLLARAHAPLWLPRWMFVGALEEVGSTRGLIACELRRIDSLATGRLVRVSSISFRVIGKDWRSPKDYGSREAAGEAYASNLKARLCRVVPVRKTTIRRSAAK